MVLALYGSFLVGAAKAFAFCCIYVKYSLNFAEASSKGAVEQN